MTDSIICHHVVYWTIPQIDVEGAVVNEQHYALNLSELAPADADRIEAMLSSCPLTGEGLSGGLDDGLELRTDPRITEYRHLFRPFIEVKRRAHDLCRFSAVWLPFDYAEYACQRPELHGYTHPSVRPLAGAG